MRIIQSAALFSMFCVALLSASQAQVQPDALARNEIARQYFPSRPDLLVDLELFDRTKLSGLILRKEDPRAGSELLNRVGSGVYVVRIVALVDADGRVAEAHVSRSSRSRIADEACRAMVLTGSYSPALYDGKTIPFIALRDCNYSVQ
jgi:hypothetical protein